MTESAGTVDRLRMILDAVHAGVVDPGLSPSELAAGVYLSRYHFDRLARAQLGEPPGAFRRRLLLERAAHRLVTTSWSVLDVAVEAGYGSHEAFTRACVRAYGLTPTALRERPPTGARDLDLAAPRGVHFQPPGTLRLPADHEETPMSVLQLLVDHHVDTLTELIDKAGGLADTDLDRPVVVSVDTIDAEQSLRTLLADMVTQEEHWLSALRGGPWPDDTDTSVEGLRRRHADAGPAYRTFVRTACEENRLAETLVDTTCEDNRTYTLGGVIGHVLTFAAVRRTLAAGALTSAGVSGVGDADPRPYLDAAIAQGSAG